MAKNTGRVKNLLDQVWEPGLSRAKKEVEEMQGQYKKKEGTLN